MKQQCIIVDDEQTARNILKKYIQDVSSLALLAEFKNAIDALGFIQKNKIDIIFLDIEMPKFSGINLAKLINPSSNVIFTTAHREFAIEGFEVNAVDYLLKPFSFERFLKAVQRVTLKQETIQNTTSDHIFIKVNKQMVKVDFSELMYIEGLSNYIKIHTKNNAFVTYYKLSELLKELPVQFMRIHKSYIVNTKKIKLYTREFVEIEKKQIPLSATYRDDLIDFFK